MIKRLFFLVCIFAHHFLCAQTLDYSNYHVVFDDNFQAYASPSGPFPSTDLITPGNAYYDKFTKFWSTDKGTYRGGGTTIFTPAETNPCGTMTLPPGVSMSSWGVIQLTDHLLPTPCTFTLNGKPETINYTSGAITTTTGYSYGIIEASIKISNDTHAPQVSSAFWSNPGGGTNHTEIDIFDVAENGYLPVKLWDEGYTPTILYEHDLGFPDLSTAFHLYSAVWDPSGVYYYVDDILVESITYDQVRTYPNFQSFTIAMQPAATGSLDGISMYVTDVKIWRKNCDVSNLDVETVTSTGTFWGEKVNSGLYKNSTIYTNNPTSDIVVAPYDLPVVFEAEATTIYPNFIADQSSPITSSISLTPGSPGYQQGPSTFIGNSFLEIIPLKNCGDTTADNNGGYSWYRQSSSDSTKDTKNIPQNAEYTNINSENVAKNTTSTLSAITQSGNLVNISKPILVYPNPAQNILTISYPCNADGTLEINIKDVTGRTVYTENIDCNQGTNVLHTVDISSFIAGVYFIDLTVNDQHIIKKFVKI